jgi:hypothetical protein
MAKKSKKKSKGNDGWLSLPTGVLNSVDYKSRTYRYGLLAGLSFGMLMVVGGVVLSIMGVAGSIEWVVTGKDFSSKLTNASPGVILTVLGMIILWRYKPHVSHETTFDRRSGSPSSVQAWGGGSARSYREVGQSVVRERVTYREEQRGVQGAPENRSMAGRIQHGEVRFEKKDS